MCILLGVENQLAISIYPVQIITLGWLNKSRALFPSKSNIVISGSVPLCLLNSSLLANSCLCTNCCRIQAKTN